VTSSWSIFIQASWCLFLATCYWVDPIKMDRIGGTCCIHGREARHVACTVEKRLWLWWLWLWLWWKPVSFSRRTLLHGVSKVMVGTLWERENVEDRGSLCERNLLKKIWRNWCRMSWAGFVWLKRDSSVRLLWIQYWTSGVCKRWAISLVHVKLFGSQEVFGTCRY